MVGDALVLTTLSYASLSLVKYMEHPENGYLFDFPYFASTVGATVIMIFGFARTEVYDHFDELKRIGLFRTVKCLVVVMLLLTACLFILKVSDNVSRLWLATWSITSAIALCGLRLLTTFAAQRLRQSGRLTKNVAIVGASEVSQQLAARFIHERSGTSLVGIFDERQSRFVEGRSSGTKVCHLRALYEHLCKGCVDEIVIAIPPSASCRVFELSQRFHPFAVSLRVLAPAGYENFQVLDSRRYGDVGTFRVMGKPLDEVAVLVKRIEDVVIASVCLLVTLPLMLAIALCIKLDSRGPVLFRQKRLGANNLPFNLLKFRSMCVEQADPHGHQLTRARDPRITRVGRFLRMTSMDELPQLINVLRGDMAFVGPVPQPPGSNGPHEEAEVQTVHDRGKGKPGLISLSRINSRHGKASTVNNFGKGLALWIVIALPLVALFNLFQTFSSRGPQSTLAFSDFLNDVNRGKVADVTIKGNNITGHFTDSRAFTTYALTDPNLVNRLTEKNVRITAAPADENVPSLFGVLISWFPMLLLIGVLIFFMRQMQGGRRAVAMSELTGRVVDAINGVEQLQRRLEQIIGDIDARFSQGQGPPPNPPTHSGGGANAAAGTATGRGFEGTGRDRGEDQTSEE
jgi:exopolysaccharide biosynthesis polyprenyl glycosylphosphotransferase